MRFPDGYLWDYPGFPSLFVSYIKSNDFFYSGHVGLPVLQICELYKIKKYNWIPISVFIVILEFFTMIVLRGHYTVDLFAGIIIAHYSFMISDKFIYIVDDYMGINKSEKSDEEYELDYKKNN
jgi:hypothetical protein